MKKKERYKIINYAVKQYNREFNHKYEFKYLSPKQFKQLLQEYHHSSMCEWMYCCYGMYKCCWQDPYGEGIWDMSQKEVDDTIMYVVYEMAKECRRDSRIVYYEDDIGVHVIIIGRDSKFSTDFLITFTNRDDILC